MRRTVSWLLAVVGLAIVAVTPSQSRAANLETLYSFCALANCADGQGPGSGLIFDTDGNLFGTTNGGGANGKGTVFEIAKTSRGRDRAADERNLHHPGLPSYASTPTTLVSFCGLANCADGSFPVAP